jgi:trans-aconitate 2-methyltransferase
MLYLHRSGTGTTKQNQQNMKKNDWNPVLYLKFNKERIQPSIDLVSRINYTDPGKIIDIGCGPGNSTQVLHDKWPDSYIVGADNSEAMIKKASEDYPDQKWILFDAAKDSVNEKFDIVFSNATIQWIPNHEHLIKNLADLLTAKGCLAIQIPLFLDMPIGKAIEEISGMKHWNFIPEQNNEKFTIHTPSFYFDQLNLYFGKADIWQTDYFHVMDSHSSILEMMRSTGLKPHLDRLHDECNKKEFEKQVLDSIKRDYPVQSNGKVLFPFRRLFFIAWK